MLLRTFQAHFYRSTHANPCLEGRVVIMIDDGLTTGVTMMSAIHAVRVQSPSRIVRPLFGSVKKGNPARLVLIKQGDLIFINVSHIPAEQPELTLVLDPA